MPEMRTSWAAGSEEQGAAYGITRIGAAYVGIPIDFLSEVCQVGDLRQMLIKSPYLTGGFDLRGHLIPIINLTRICGFDDPVNRPKFAVILRRGDALLAFLVDEVMGITHVDRQSVQSLQQSAGAADQICVTGVFLDRNRLVSVADIDAIFDLPGIFSVKVPAVAQTFATDGSSTSMLTFEAGGAWFSVSAVDVYGTVPRQTIEVNAMTSGFCLGAITYHQRRVPVMSTVDLMGIGRRIDRTSSEVVILRCPDDRLLGLAVDAIRDIQTVDPHKLAAVPDAIARRNDYLSSVHVKPDGSQIYVIATERLVTAPAVAAMASLSTPAAASAEVVTDDRMMGGNTRRLVERFLIFQAGRAIAVPLDQVTCIIAAPRSVIPATQAHSGLVGYFSRQQQSVPLVDLNALLGLGSADSDMARVLLTGEGAGQIGFQVERIFGIETSSWILRGLAADGPGAETLVQLGSGDGKRVMPVIDLDLIAGQNFVVTQRVDRHDLSFGAMSGLV
jgi:purine-binding chemotaxis protein CheW